MHSIVMSSSPVFLPISSFIACPTPCCPFLPLTPLQSPLKKTRYQDATTLEVPSLFVSCSPMTSQPFAAQSLSRVSMSHTVNAVDRCCANVEYAERELLQPRPRPGGLVFLASGLLLRPLPPSLLPSKYPPPFTQFRCFLPRSLPSFFRNAGCGTPTTPRLLHRRHYCLLACALRAILLSSLRVPRFPRRRYPNFSTAGMVAAGNDFALLRCITAS